LGRLKGVDKDLSPKFAAEKKEQGKDHTLEKVAGTIKGPKGMAISDKDLTGGGNNFGVIFWTARVGRNDLLSVGPP